jgi:hypothetical protein
MDLLQKFFRYYHERGMANRNEAKKRTLRDEESCCESLMHRLRPFSQVFKLVGDAVEL